MTVTVEVPDHVAEHLHLGGAGQSRRALELMALEGYRSGGLSRGLVSEMLGMGFHDTESFLKLHNAYLDYSLEDFDRDGAALRELLGR